MRLCHTMDNLEWLWWRFALVPRHERLMVCDMVNILRFLGNYTDVFSTVINNHDILVTFCWCYLAYSLLLCLPPTYSASFVMLLLIIGLFFFKIKRNSFTKFIVVFGQILVIFNNVNICVGSPFIINNGDFVRRFQILCWFVISNTRIEFLRNPIQKSIKLYHLKDEYHLAQNSSPPYYPP